MPAAPPAIRFVAAEAGDRLLLLTFVAMGCGVNGRQRPRLSRRESGHWSTAGSGGSASAGEDVRAYNDGFSDAFCSTQGSCDSDSGTRAPRDVAEPCKTVGSDWTPRALHQRNGTGVTGTTRWK